MPRRKKKASKFIVSGISTYIDKVGKITSEITAEKIVTDLKEQGPYYTGEFEENWVVLPGQVNISANKKSSFSAREKLQGWGSNQFPFTRRITPVDIPPLAKGQYDYTIDNRMGYRDISLDLAPGRYAVDKNNTADPDSLLKYVQAAGLRNALKEATGQASRDPQLRGNKGFG